VTRSTSACLRVSDGSGQPKPPVQCSRCSNEAHIMVRGQPLCAACFKAITVRATKKVREETQQ